MKKNQMVFAGLVAVVALGAFFALRKPAAPKAVEGVPAYRLKGNPAAKAVIVEFSDFQCPACRYAQEPLRDLKAKYGDDLLIVFHHYPLRMHNWAIHAAVTAECAGRQGKFWPVHDRLFEEQPVWSKDQNATALFEKMIEEAGLDLKTFRACAQGPEAKAAVQADIDLGNRHKLTATPTFFSGQLRIVGPNQLIKLGAQSIDVQLQ